MDDYEFQFIDKSELKGIVQRVLDRRRKEKEEKILKEFEACGFDGETDGNVNQSAEEIIVNESSEEIIVEPIEIETGRQSLDDHIDLDDVEHADLNDCIVWKPSSDRTEFSDKSRSGLRIPCATPRVHYDDVLIQDSNRNGFDLPTAFDKGCIGDHREEPVSYKDHGRPCNHDSRKSSAPAPNYPNVAMLFIRITSFQRFITSALDQIMPKLLERKFFDGPRDFEKRQKRFLAFANLLSRNYLYRIERTIVDIQSIELEMVTERQAIALIMKICTLYNIIEFSLQAFLKNLSNCVDSEVPEKMPIFLKLIRDATEMCIDKEIFDHDDAIAKGLVSKLRMVLQKLNEFDRATRTKRKALKARYEVEYRLEKTLSISTLNIKSKSNLSMYAETVAPRRRSVSKQRQKSSIISSLRSKSAQRSKKIAPAPQKQVRQTDTTAADDNPTTQKNDDEMLKEDDILLTLRLDYVQSTIEKEQMRLKCKGECDDLYENESNHILNEIVANFEGVGI